MRRRQKRDTISDDKENRKEWFNNVKLPVMNRSQCCCEMCGVNYPETKDFGASWAGQSNLQPYLHTLEFPPFQRYLICLTRNA